MGGEELRLSITDLNTGETPQPKLVLRDGPVDFPSPPNPLSPKIRRKFEKETGLNRPNFWGEGELNFLLSMDLQVLTTAATRLRSLALESRHRSGQSAPMSLHQAPHQLPLNSQLVDQSN